MPKNGGKHVPQKSYSEYDWASEPGSSLHRPADSAEKLLIDARRVLDGLKDDLAHGVVIDPRVITQIEETIAKYDPASADGIPDLSRQIRELTAFGTGKRNN